MITEATIPVAGTQQSLRGFQVATSAGQGIIEAISQVDPDDVSAVQRIVKGAPASGANLGGAVVYLTPEQIAQIAPAAFAGLTNDQLRAAAVPVVVAALPLPAGAATDAGLQSVYQQLATGQTHVVVDNQPTGGATSAKQDAGNASLASLDGKTPALVGGRQPVDGSGVTQPVSATSLPLPNGAATEATLAATNAALGADGASPPAIPGTGVRGWLRSIYERLLATLTVQGTVTANAGSGTFNTRALASGTDSITTVPSGTQGVSGTVSVNNFPATQPVSGSVAVSNLPATQPVSGSVSIANFPATQPVSAASLPLPAGAAADSTVAALNPARGTSTPYGGTAGTVTVPAGARVLSFTGHAAASGATVQVKGFGAADATVPVPAGNSVGDQWSGLVGGAASSIIFTGTDSYYAVLNA